MKNKNRTIKAKTLQSISLKISWAIRDLEYQAHTVSTYFGKNARIVKLWKAELQRLKKLRAATLLEFKPKVAN